MKLLSRSLSLSISLSVSVCLSVTRSLSPCLSLACALSTSKGTLLCIHCSKENSWTPKQCCKLISSIARYSEKMQTKKIYRVFRKNSLDKNCILFLWCLPDSIDVLRSKPTYTRNNTRT